MNNFRAPYMDARPLILISSALLCLALLTGCAPEPRPLASTGDASLHAVKSKEIKDVMQSLEHEVYKQNNKMLKIDGPRIRYAKRLADKLELMSSEIVEREVEAKGLGLDAGELEVFRQYADKLNDHAAVFWRIAETGQTKPMESALNDLVETCDACHTRFRSE
ncbi:MAG: cytochrome c [Gammaproteobacteria bacterium]|nr:cytochrome c [Gammaproteobacteria bacterium]